MKSRDSTGEPKKSRDGQKRRGQPKCAREGQSSRKRAAEGSLTPATTPSAPGWRRPLCSCCCSTWCGPGAESRGKPSGREKRAAVRLLLFCGKTSAGFCRLAHLGGHAEHGVGHLVPELSLFVAKAAGLLRGAGWCVGKRGTQAKGGETPPTPRFVAGPQRLQRTLRMVPKSSREMLGIILLSPKLL